MKFWRPLGIFLAAFVISLEFWPLYLAMEDEAVVVYGAQRLLEGQMIYRDWDTHLSPGSFVVSALWFGLLGFQAPATRMLFALVFAGTALLIDQAAQHCLKGRWQWLPSLLWASCGVLEFPILSYHWFATAMATATLLAGLHWVARPSRATAFAVGAAVASAGWFLQSEGLVGVLMVTFWWLRFRPRHLGTVMLACLSISALLWLPLVSQWPKILAQNLGLAHHLHFNRKVYSWANWTFFLSHYQGLSPQQGLLPYAAALSHIFVNGLRYLGLPWLVLGCWWGAEKKRDRTGIVVAGAMLAWVLATANRQDILYVSFLSPGWALLLTKALQLMPGGAWLAAGLAVLEGAGWLGRWALRQQAYVYPVNTRAGVYYTNDPGQAAGLNLVFGWLRELPPQTEVLCFPYLPSFYSLGQLHNPIRRQTLVPELDPAEAFPQALQALRDKKVEWILYVAPNAAEIQGEYDIPAEKVEREWEAARRRMTDGYPLLRGDLRLGLYRRRQI